MGNLAAIKARARRAVHAAFSLSATYQDASLSAPVPIPVRWHNRLVLLGDYQSDGYANVIEGIERIIFNREQLQEAGIRPVTGGMVIVTDEGFNETVLYLDQREPYVGPIEEKWQVRR